ncbi:unnamed protein product [Ceutorhynchus assimilis]|uniref:Uncharacterized protein n=1 Tax=Ceutorhynchus assimilis TaxID=467358 RepID=A0A9N9QHX3_9CUCU|nr:unnamed protein product [Ceutorhynchus assimilis]
MDRFLKHKKAASSDLPEGPEAEAGTSGISSTSKDTTANTRTEYISFSSSDSEEESHHSRTKSAEVTMMDSETHMAAIDRVLENWEALRLFFQSEYLEEELQAAKDLMESLENPIFKVYITFLSYVLEQVNKLNLEFQAEKPKLHLLLKRTSDLYRSILRNYVKQLLIATD